MAGLDNCCGCGTAAGEKRVCAAKAWHGRIPFNREIPTGGRYRPEGETAPTKYRKVVRQSLCTTTTHIEDDDDVVQYSGTKCTAEIGRYTGILTEASAVMYPNISTGTFDADYIDANHIADPYNGHLITHVGSDDDSGWNIEAGEEGSFVDLLWPVWRQAAYFCAGEGDCNTSDSYAVYEAVAANVDDALLFMLNSSAWAAFETAHELATGSVAAAFADCGISITKSSSATALSFTITVDQECCDSEGGIQYDDGECNGTHIVYEVTATLSEEYTSAQLNDDINTLLAEWDLTDDDAVPWNTTGCLEKILMTYDEPDSAQNPDWLCQGETPLTGYTGDMIGSPPTPYLSEFLFYRGGCRVYIPDAAAETPGVMIAQKMAFALTSHPAHNFCRPCGEDRDYDDIWDEDLTPGWCGRADIYSVEILPSTLVRVTVTNGVYPVGHFDEGDPRQVRVKTGDVINIVSCPGFTDIEGNWTITKVTDASFTLDGSDGETGTYTTGGTADYVTPTPGAYTWDDMTAKGDYGQLTWEWDWRGDDANVFEYGDVPGDQIIDCTDGNLTPTGAVVFVQPYDAGATYDNADFYDMPDLTPDYDFGSLWFAEPRDWMHDPMWWNEEAPINNTYTDYIQEWLCAVPAGAPEIGEAAGLLDPPIPQPLGCDGTGNCGPPSFGACW